MHSPTSISEQPYIWTGHLPQPELVQKLVSEAHARFTSNTEGQNSQVGLAFVTILPASRLPNYRPGELPAGPPARR